MNLVVVRHFEANMSKKYLFRLPDDVSVDAGDYVICNTKNGESLGQCCTSNFRGDPDVVTKFWGGCGKEIKPVLKALRPCVLEYPEDKTDEQRMKDGINAMINLSGVINANMVKAPEAHYGAYEKD